MQNFTSMAIVLVVLFFSIITPCFALDVGISEVLFSIKAKSDIQLVKPENRIVMVYDIAKLIATAFEIPVSSEEPWRPDNSPLPFELDSEIKITAGMTLETALTQVLDETGNVLAYDFSQKVLVIYPKFSEHRIFSCADTIINTELPGVTVWNAMKSIAKTLNCGNSAPSILEIEPEPTLHGKEVPKDFTEDDYIRLESQEISARQWLCKIIAQTKIPISYRMSTYYRPTKFPDSKPRTRIIISFTGPGLLRSQEATLMSREELKWWMNEMEELRCED